MRGFWFFIYSRRNLVGVVLALVGLGLFFAGLIQDFWLLIVVGLYLIGLMVTPPDPQYELSLHSQADIAQLRNELQEMVGKVRKRLPAESLQKVLSIQMLIEELLPRLKSLEQSGDHNAYTIRQTVLDYLPATLQNYLNLPNTFAQVHPLKNGKTARQLLLEQLGLLEQTIQDISHSVFSGDAQKVLVNGRFLQERFSNAESFFVAAEQR